jgi:hypothetical protein
MVPVSFRSGAKGDYVFLVFWFFSNQTRYAAIRGNAFGDRAP